MFKRLQKHLFCFPDTNIFCDGADILLDTLTRQHTETLKDKLDHDCTDSSGQDQQVLSQIGIAALMKKYR